MPNDTVKPKRRARISPSPLYRDEAREDIHCLIFLDIDGVLHPGAKEGEALVPFTQLKKLHDTLKKMQQKRDLKGDVLKMKGVISSSWRNLAELDEIIATLDKESPGFGLFIEGRTGTRESDPVGERRLEAYDYLKSRPGKVGFFVALDDRIDLFGGAALAPHWLVQADSSVGFDDECAVRLEGVIDALSSCPSGLVKKVKPLGMRM